MNDRIFVSIASYRDPELIPTIQDAIAMARNPDRISFGVCHQGHAEELSDLPHSNKIRIEHIPHTESKGVGMARALAEGLWQGEEYAMQLDSHHRFLDDWDDRAIEDLAKCPHPKPLLTGYLPNYQPPHDKKKFTQTELMIRTKDPVIRFGSKPVAPGRDAPYPGRLMSGHFMFSRSERLQECPNDSWVYMNGEEAHMSIKALLRGWQPFGLYRPIAWHQYGRRAHHHWQDNHEWGKLNRLSIDRIWGEIRENKNLIGAEAFC